MTFLTTLHTPRQLNPGSTFSYDKLPWDMYNVTCMPYYVSALINFFVNLDSVGINFKNIVGITIGGGIFTVLLLLSITIIFFMIWMKCFRHKGSNQLDAIEGNNDKIACHHNININCNLTQICKQIQILHTNVLSSIKRCCTCLYGCFQFN